MLINIQSYSASHKCLVSLHSNNIIIRHGVWMTVKIEYLMFGNDLKIRVIMGIRRKCYQHLRPKACIQVSVIRLESL